MRERNSAHGRDRLRIEFAVVGHMTRKTLTVYRGKRTVRDIRLTTVDNFNYQLCISNYVRGKKK